MEEALVNERAGKHYLERGNDELASRFLRESYTNCMKGGVEWKTCGTMTRALNTSCMI